MKEIIQEIQNKLRLAMDGANSAAMRKRGLSYKMNFGVPLVTLRQMAIPYKGNNALAELLWKEDTREFKILAGLIQTPENFENADIWIQDIDNMELAEQTSMHLFSKLPQADEYADKWIKSDNLYIKISAYLTYARLFQKEYKFEPKEELLFISTCFIDLQTANVQLTNAIINALKKYGRNTSLKGEEILSACLKSNLKEDLKKTIYADMLFEFNYYLSLTSLINQN
ncbi:peptidase [Bacteroidales bacterium]|nr:peptidase [Bacteroidales bacterium]